MSDLIKVGMADLKATRAPAGLTTLGLGSCVGICLYDPRTKVTGMAHIMLPSSKTIRNNQNKAKFADTGLETLIDEMIRLGANSDRIVCKIAGGAQMFAVSSGNDVMQVGKRNTEAVRALLSERKIPLLADETGGNFGRTIEFYSTTGELFIKTIGHGNRTV